MTLHTLLSGSNAAMSAIAGVFFLRYGSLTRDRFFVLWAFAFWMLAANWAMIGTVEATAEGRHYAYLIRLAAFVVIAVAIIDKNRDRRP